MPIRSIFIIAYKYDFIISNPPYIKKFNIKRLEDNVKNFEPYLALEAGIDGFREIYKLILKSKLILKRNGKLISEFEYAETL